MYICYTICLSVCLKICWHSSNMPFPITCCDEFWNTKAIASSRKSLLKGVILRQQSHQLHDESTVSETQIPSNLLPYHHFGRKISEPNRTKDLTILWFGFSFRRTWRRRRGRAHSLTQRTEAISPVHHLHTVHRICLSYVAIFTYRGISKISMFCLDWLGVPLASRGFVPEGRGGSGSRAAVLAPCRTLVHASLPGSLSRHCSARPSRLPACVLFLSPPGSCTCALSLPRRKVPPATGAGCWDPFSLLSLGRQPHSRARLRAPRGCAGFSSHLCRAIFNEPPA